MEFQLRHGWQAAFADRLVFTGLLPGIFLCSMKSIRPRHPLAVITVQSLWCGPCWFLDFSNMGWRDAPAGKHGRIVAKGSHFEFEKLPGVAQRFHGGGARVCAWLRWCAAVRDSGCAQTGRNPVLRGHLARFGRCDVSLRDCRMTSALDAKGSKMIRFSQSKLVVGYVEIS